MQIGVRTQFEKPLRTPFIQVHFAGIETSMRWNGYMDGAIESSYLTVNEILNIQ